MVGRRYGPEQKGHEEAEALIFTTLVMCAKLVMTLPAATSMWRGVASSNYIAIFE